MNDFCYFTDAISKLFDLENMRLISGTSDRSNECMRPFLCDMNTSFYAQDKLADKHVIWSELS
jgi:hypothetical protein